MIPHVYQVALLVGSNNVGYIVSCPRGLFSGCDSLTAGQSLHGFIEGVKLSLEVSGKIKGYTVVTSAYIGSDPQGNGAKAATNSPAPHLIRAEDTASPRPSDSAQAERPDATPTTGAVVFASEPLGADIFIDGKFVGNTPSTIQLSAGEHTVLVEASGHKAWSRTLTVTTGSKSTVQAVLTPGA